MEIRRVTNESDLDFHFTQYEVFIGHGADNARFQTSWALKSGDDAAVYNLVDDDGTVVGGFCLYRGRAAIAMRKMPKETVQEIVRTHQPEQVFELNYVWLAPSVRGRRQSAELWIKIAEVVGACREDAMVIFSVNASNRGLRRLYTPAIEAPLWVEDEQPLHFFRSTPERFRAIPERARADLRRRLEARATRHAAA